MGRLEPKLIEAYKCPTCQGIIVGTREEAQRHVDVPLGMKLPIGLVFKYAKDYMTFGIVRSTEIIQENVFVRKLELHDHKHNLAIYEDRGPGSFYSGDVTSKRFIECLRNEEFNLLTQEEFKRFRRIFSGPSLRNLAFYNLSIRSLKRTTAELETLLSETAAETAGQVRDRGEAEAGGGG